jgi:hypothetical protein
LRSRAETVLGDRAIPIISGREGVIIYFEDANLLHGIPFYICTVKVGCLLFACYLFSIAVLPCNDRETCQDEIKSGITILNTDNHEHDGAEQDFCSPFCICQCCNAHAQQANYFTLTFGLPAFTEPINTYIPTTVQILPHTFWQPPKLS